MKITPQKSDESARSYVLRLLRENITNATLEPGALISENELSKALGISRAPVREAIIELSQSKIIEVLPQRGSRIALIDMSMVEEVVFLRKTIEKAVVREACSKASSEILAQMENNLKLQDFYLNNRNAEKQMELDNEFHKLIYGCCGKNSCYSIVDSMSIHFDRVRSLALISVKELKIVADHWDIYEAIKNNQPDEAERLIDLHLSRYQVDEKAIREKYPKYFA